ncbi:MAG TPA: methyltransferase [Methylococcus sp.]|nr:methyltransferase [Methylococcus sp.]
MTLITTPCRDREDVRAFFDRLAPDYRDLHGHAAKALRHRLRLIDTLMQGTGRDLLVEIGCGTGMHLFPLAQRFRKVHGTDLSPAMIARAEALRRRHPESGRITLAVDPAEELASVGTAKADVVLCVGALEHMLQPEAVLRQVRRVLNPRGRFLCLTPNGEFLWYAWLAPRLGYATRHLSTDRFFRTAELADLLRGAGLRPEVIGFWSFVPRGDMPMFLARLFTFLDGVGRGCGLSRLRGGLYCRAVPFAEIES